MTDFYFTSSDGNGVDEGGDILGTCVLPRKHEAVVRKRMNTLRSTLRRQRDGEKKSRSDVRNLFNSSNRVSVPSTYMYSC